MAELATADLDDLDSVRAQVVVGDGVALVAHDHARLQSQHVVTKACRSAGASTASSGEG